MPESPKVKVTENGPYLIYGCIPVVGKEIISEKDKTAIGWREVKNYPSQKITYLCRCGMSRNKPFCDSTHIKVKFNGTETADESYLKEPKKYLGPGMELTDFEPLCASARFCHRGGGIWNLIKKTDNQEAKRMVIEEAADCPSGRLVVAEKQPKKVLEPTFERSVVAIWDTVGGGLGPLWVRGKIPVFSSSGKKYSVRNRVTLCRCGKSANKPFCDSSHYPEEHEHQ